MSDEVIETKIVCDNCRREAPLEKFNGESTFRVPPNWIAVAPQVRRGRFDDDSLLKEFKGHELNQKIKEMIPVIHICEQCLIEGEGLEEKRAKKLAEKKRKEQEKERKARKKRETEISRVTKVTSGRRLYVEGP